jgi:hypothetical protein
MISALNPYFDEYDGKKHSNGNGPEGAATLRFPAATGSNETISHEIQRF